MNVAFYELVGTRVAIHCDDAVFGAEIRRLLEPALVRPTLRRPDAFFSIVSSDGERRLILGGEELTSGPDGRLLDHLVSQLNYLAVERCPHLAVHAGVVANEGRVVAFPAPSGSGKSTLTAACIKAGFAYVSDEALCLRLTDGAVVPYPKPINLWPPSLARLGLAADRVRPLLVTARDLGGDAATGPLHLTDVVILDHDSPTTHLRPIARTQILMALMRNSFNHYRYRRAAFDIATEMTRRSRAWALSYDDPAEAAALLREELAPVPARAATG